MCFSVKGMSLTLLVLTRMEPMFSGREMSLSGDWSCILTWDTFWSVVWDAISAILSYQNLLLEVEDYCQRYKLHFFILV